MADETTQAEEETSWWLFDALAEAEQPSTSFDEPLVWPEVLDWGDVGDPADGLRFPEAYDPRAFELDGPIFPPEFDLDPYLPAPPPPVEGPEPSAGPPAEGDDQATVAVATPLGALGGASAPPGAPRVDEFIPESIWAADASAGMAGAAGAAATAVATELDRGPDGWRRRFDIRHGNAAVIALISFVSLLLLGMFLSVRARDNIPTDTSRTRTTTDQIAVQGTLNTVPLTLPSTTGAPPATINIAELVPAPETTAGGGTGTGGGATGSGGTTATTAPRAGAGGGTGTTQPASQPTNTTAAPQTTAPSTTAAPPPSTTQPLPPTTATTVPTTPTTFDFTPFTAIPGFTIPDGFSRS